MSTVELHVEDPNVIPPSDDIPLAERLRIQHQAGRLLAEAWKAVEDTGLPYDSHLTLVSCVVADELRVWSEPVQFMVEPGRDGLIEFVLRRYEEAKADV